MTHTTKTVLHVDDDPSQFPIVAALLEKRGYQVHTTDSPDDVESALLRTGARIVLLDIDMPGKDGLTLLKEIKQNDGGIQVIMVTGMVTMATILRAMRWGAEACIFKPITDPTALLEALDATEAKIRRWWRAVEELTQQRRGLEQRIEATG